MIWLNPIFSVCHILNVYEIYTDRRKQKKKQDIIIFALLLKITYLKPIYKHRCIIKLDHIIQEFSNLHFYT